MGGELRREISETGKKERHRLICPSFSSETNGPKCTKITNGFIHILKH